MWRNSRSWTLANSMTWSVSAQSRIGDEAGRPVEHDEIGGRVRDGQPRGLADLVAAERLGLEPDQAGDPAGVLLEPVGAALAELEDDVLLAHRADREVVDRGPEPLDPRGQQRARRLGQRGRIGQPPGQLQQGRGRGLERELDGQRDRAEVEERQLGPRAPRPATSLPAGGSPSVRAGPGWARGDSRSTPASACGGATGRARPGASARARSRSISSPMSKANARWTTTDSGLSGQSSSAHRRRPAASVREADRARGRRRRCSSITAVPGGPGPRRARGRIRTRLAGPESGIISISLAPRVGDSSSATRAVGRRRAWNRRCGRSTSLAIGGSWARHQISASAGDQPPASAHAARARARLSRVLVAIVGVLLQAAEHDLLQVGRDLGPVSAREGRPDRGRGPPSRPWRRSRRTADGR